MLERRFFGFSNLEGYLTDIEHVMEHTDTGLPFRRGLSPEMKVAYVIHTTEQPVGLGAEPFMTELGDKADDYTLCHSEEKQPQPRA